MAFTILKFNAGESGISTIDTKTTMPFLGLGGYRQMLDVEEWIDATINNVCRADFLYPVTKVLSAVAGGRKYAD
jgi:hypothetical protein